MTFGLGFMLGLAVMLVFSEAWAVRPITKLWLKALEENAELKCKMRKMRDNQSNTTIVEQ